MPYDAVTPAQFKTAKARFAAVPDATVQAYLDQAGIMVDRSWPEKLYQPGIIAFTCHLMTLDGLGADAASQAYAKGAAAFQSIKTGDVTLTRFRSSAEGDYSYAGWLAQTSCGQQFWQWLRMFRGGPRVAMGAIDAPASGYAKDHPMWGWAC